MNYVRRRGLTYYYDRQIPADLRHHYNGQTHRRISLKTRDYDAALRLARRQAADDDDQWALWRRVAAGERLGVTPSTIYHQMRERGLRYIEQTVAANPHLAEDSEQWELWKEDEIDRMRDEAELRAAQQGQPTIDDRAELLPLDRARIIGKVDAFAAASGQTPTVRREYEKSMKEVASEYFTHWRRTHAQERAGRVTNTPQQKKATLDLFASYWGTRPLRRVRRTDAADFVDTLRSFSPNWARNGTWADDDSRPTWNELVATYAHHEIGLSAQTMNRHVHVLMDLWKWGTQRDYCQGDNPFSGHIRPITRRNSKKYDPWEKDELEALLIPPPPRRDLYELVLVLLYSGMRASEAADLTWGQVRKDGSTHSFDIPDAKTEAGKRQVPLHPRLSWILEKTRGSDETPLWPSFNPEGPGKKRGADASRLFSDYKRTRGFEGRQKALHSFRDNAIECLDRKGVRESDIAQIVGHEKPSFTTRTYSRGITIHQAAEIVALIEYEAQLPFPVEVYGTDTRLPTPRKRRRFNRERSPS